MTEDCVKLMKSQKIRSQNGEAREGEAREGDARAEEEGQPETLIHQSQPRRDLERGKGMILLWKSQLARKGEPERQKTKSNPVMKKKRQMRRLRRQQKNVRRKRSMKPKILVKVNGERKGKGRFRRLKLR